MVQDFDMQLKRFRNKPIIKNLIALSFFQLTNYLVPLAIIPYIIRMIGVEKFGLVSFAQAVMIFFSVVVDYGFNLTSTQDISINQKDHGKITNIFSATISTKIFLGFLAFLLTLLGIIIFKKLNENTVVFISAFSLVIGQILLPVWFFQGMEKMQFITYLNAFAKLLTVILIFTLVHQENDYILILPIYAIGNIAASLTSLYIVFRVFKIRFFFSSLKIIIGEIKKGFSIFTANISVALYNSIAIIILGIFTNDLTIGYYSVAEKVILVVKQLLGIFSSAIFPHLCKLAVEGIEETKRFWRKILLPFLFGVFLLCTIIFLFSVQIVYFLTGGYESHASLLVRLLAFIPLIVATNIPSYQTLIANNLRKECLIVLISASLLNIVLNTILSYYMEAIGTAFSLLITEVFISLGLFIVLQKSVKRLAN